MDIFIPLSSGFIFTLLATPLTIYFANKFHLVDDPSTRPHPAHLHLKTTPRAGGLAIFIGLVISILILVPFDKHIAGILTGLSVLLLMGLLDDRLHNFSPYLRLGLQLLAALIAVGSGIGISYITNPLGGIIHLDQFSWNFNLLGTHTIIILADLFAIIWIVGLMNVVNWSKGVDGQMPGIIATAALTIGLVAYNFFLQGDQNQYHLSTLSFITAGSSIAFLLFNWHPAKIFPGFSGSTILGFMIAILAILSSAKIATAALVLLIPISDALYIFWRRIITGRSPVWADRGHLHHKLIDLGLSQPTIALFYILSCSIFASLALFLTSEYKFLAAISIGIITIVTIFTLQQLIKKHPRH